MSFCLWNSLYGLKQASHNWCQKTTNSLNTSVSNSHESSIPSLFINKVIVSFPPLSTLMTSFWLEIRTRKCKPQRKIQTTSSKLKIQETSNIFLGIEVARTPKGLVLSQQKYILDILEDCGLQGSKPSSFSIDKNMELDKAQKDPKVDVSRYHRIIGHLLYLQATWPDITYSVYV